MLTHAQKYAELESFFWQKWSDYTAAR